MNYLGIMKFDQLNQIVHSGPEIIAGTPVFTSIRGPLQNLIGLLHNQVYDFIHNGLDSACLH